MTIDEFLKEFTATVKARKPRVGKSARIRLYVSDLPYCPITYVCQIKKGWPRFSLGDWDQAAERLGLHYSAGLKIAHAADRDYGSDPQIRARLEEVFKSP